MFLQTFFFLFLFSIFFSSSLFTFWWHDTRTRCPVHSHWTGCNVARYARRFIKSSNNTKLEKEREREKRKLCFVFCLFIWLHADMINKTFGVEYFAICNVVFPVWHENKLHQLSGLSEKDQLRTLRQYQEIINSMHFNCILFGFLFQATLSYRLLLRMDFMQNFV